MTPFEQAVARAYGSDMRCLIAGCSLERVKQGMRGASHYAVRGEVYWMDTTNRGIELRERPAAPPVAIVQWRDVMAHIRALPEAIRAESRDVDHDAHRPPASGLEWHNPSEPHRVTEGERFAHLLWHQHVQDRTAAVLHRAFPEADHEDALDLFAAVGLTT